MTGRKPSESAACQRLRRRALALGVGIQRDRDSYSIDDFFTGLTLEQADAELARMEREDAESETLAAPTPSWIGLIAEGEE